MYHVIDSIEKANLLSNYMSMSIYGAGYILTLTYSYIYLYIDVLNKYNFYMSIYR